MYKRGFKAIVILLLGAAVCAAAYTRYPLKHTAEILRYSKQYALPPELVCAVVNAESRFRPEAKSRKGAGGLMQLMPQTAAWGAREIGLDYDEAALHTPEINLQIGCWYLSALYDQYGDWLTALAAYNAGSGNVSGWIRDYGRLAELNDIRYPETRRYVRRVLADEKVYRWILRLTNKEAFSKFGFFGAGETYCCLNSAHARKIFRISKEANTGGTYD